MIKVLYYTDQFTFIIEQPIYNQEQAVATAYVVFSTTFERSIFFLK